MDTVSHVFGAKGSLVFRPTFFVFLIRKYFFLLLCRP